MMIELSVTNVLMILSTFGAIISSVFGYWMSSVSSQNKDLKKELDELSACIQDTRENYVTNSNFNKAHDKLDSKLDMILRSVTSSGFGRRKDDV